MIIYQKEEAIKEIIITLTTFNFNFKLNNDSLRGWFAISDKVNYALYSDALQQNTTTKL
jgi:hypothetical protein